MVSAHSGSDIRREQFLSRMPGSLSGWQSVAADTLSLLCSDQKITKAIIENTKDKNQKILTLDSMQSATSDDVKAGMTYLSVMEDNLEVLKEALQ